jgi:hypothetical protein
MPEKPSTSLSGAGITTGGPEIGTPDFTELRVVTRIRPFPQDVWERRCYGYLVKQMHASPDRTRRTKAEFDNDCRVRFHVKANSFEYCWREAIKVSGARWDQPGRRPR